MATSRFNVTIPAEAKCSLIAIQERFRKRGGHVPSMAAIASMAIAQLRRALVDGNLHMVSEEQLQEMVDRCVDAQRAAWASAVSLLRSVLETEGIEHEIDIGGPEDPYVVRIIRRRAEDQGGDVVWLQAAEMRSIQGPRLEVLA